MNNYDYPNEDDMHRRGFAHVHEAFAPSSAGEKTARDDRSPEGSRGCSEQALDKLMPIPQSNWERAADLEYQALRHGSAEADAILAAQIAKVRKIRHEEYGTPVD